ncbi:MAG: MBL fold metallo-hydrolase [Methanomicrobiales archaeon]|nr:MBL fold metallo-hydrolase [Methanomicrobiales archaeon]
MRIAVLGSGSRGNCTYIEGSDSAILLDAGFSAAETMRRLALVKADPGMIRAIILTHEHTDHVRGLPAIARRLNVPVYGTEGTLACCHARLERHGALTAIRMGDGFGIEGFEIEPLAASHDAWEPCGFRVSENGASIGCYTDSGVVSPRIIEDLKKCDAILLESNHCPEMLRTGPYPEMLKRRIRSKRGHLSNLAAASVLRELKSDVPYVILAHLSEVNNNPAKALACARGALGFFAEDVVLSAASQHEAGPLVRI